MRTTGAGFTTHSIICKGLGLFLCIILSISAFSSGISKGREPAWVRIGHFDPASAIPVRQMEEGYYFLLAEKQSNVSTDERYSRYVRKVVNDAGVQNSTRISFEYNKSFEQVIVHSVNIVRDGKVMDRLDLSKFKAMEQQNDLVNNMYNDEVTSILLLEDVRVGDIIDVSYTEKGRNPIMPDKYYEYFSLGYGAPVAKIYSSVILPESRHLHFKYYNDAPQPKVTHDNGNVIYSWEVSDVPLIKLDDGTPLGYDPYPGVSVSEYDTWLQVKQWAQNIYKPVFGAPSPEADRLAADIEARYKVVDDRVIAAVRYVQDKIRYFGMETGINTHMPNVPAVTLRHGYGDCKDKSALLCSILRAMHIPAHPVLISTFDPGGVADHLPSAAIFNHVCVQVLVHDSTYYFDATSASQPADLDHYHFPPYKAGLVVTDTSTGITTIPYSDNGARTLILCHIQADDSSRPARMTVTTTYYGICADQFLDQWNTQSHQDIEKNYLNFYAREYPGIVSVENLKITAQDSLVNMVSTEEVYSIENFWVRSKPGELQREFFAYNLLGLLNRPKDKKRTMPIGISYPQHYVEEYEVVLPFAFSVKRENKTISNDAFTFTGSYSYLNEDRSLHLRYTYDTKADRIPASQSAKYFEDIEELTRMIDYIILWHPYAAVSGGYSYLIIFIFLIALAACIVGARWLYIHYDPLPAIPSAEGRGIGGWLLVPAFSITILPFYFLYYLATNQYFNEINIDIIFDKSALNYNPALGYFILVDMVFKTILTVSSFLMLILFYQRRTSLPRVFIAYMLFNIFTQIVIIAVNERMGLSNEGRAVVAERAAMYTIIWGLYMYLSQRVRETFVVTRRPHIPPSDDAMPEHDRFMPLPTIDQAPSEVAPQG